MIFIELDLKQLNGLLSRNGKNTIALCMHVAQSSAKGTHKNSKRT